MQTKENNNLIFVRLFPDENLHEKLVEACKKHKVKTTVVISGIGQLKNFELGYFKEKKEYKREKFDKPHELLSLNGTVCRQKDGKYEVHLHASLGDENKKVIGGHLFYGTVEVTNEIVLIKSDIEIIRRAEEKTGLRGMFLE
jgi:predicted DNA-binding protein with PD1-like motif